MSKIDDILNQLYLGNPHLLFPEEAKAQLKELLMPEEKEEPRRKYPTRKEMTDLGVIYGHNQCREEILKKFE